MRRFSSAASQASTNSSEASRLVRVACFTIFWLSRMNSGSGTRFRLRITLSESNSRIPQPHVCFAATSAVSMTLLAGAFHQIPETFCEIGRATAVFPAGVPSLPVRRRSEHSRERASAAGQRHEACAPLGWRTNCSTRMHTPGHLSRSSRAERNPFSTR